VNIQNGERVETERLDDSKTSHLAGLAAGSEITGPCSHRCVGVGKPVCSGKKKTA
jgi:hypothetical protein